MGNGMTKSKQNQYCEGATVGDRIGGEMWRMGTRGDGGVRRYFHRSMVIIKRLILK